MFISLPYYHKPWIWLIIQKFTKKFIKVYIFSRRNYRADINQGKSPTDTDLDGDASWKSGIFGKKNWGAIAEEAKRNSLAIAQRERKKNRRNR